MELRAQRKLTTAFIKTQPVVLTLHPRERVKQPAGGFTWTTDPEGPRDPQTMRLNEPTLGVGNTRPTITQDGIERVVEFILLGAWDAEIGVYDVFDHGGGRWEVVQLVHDNGYERRAIVARHG